jgi:pimeloyl-ACP methyl ester carboxylesterase
VPIVRTADFECWYQDDCFADPWEESDVVVIQHGCGRNSEHWRSWVPELGTRFRVMRRDMRAHGRSTAGMADFPWTERAMAEDVVAFLDALGIGPVHYVGESLGGVTGIAMGALFPDYLHTLTLVQTPIHLGQGLNDYCRGDFPTWSDALRTLGPGGWVATQLASDDQRSRWEREQWDACDADALVRLADATLTIDAEQYLPQIRVPTLILAPGASPMTSLDDQLLMQAVIPDASIEVFDGRGHDIYLTETRRCTDRIIEFISARRSVSVGGA